MRTARWHARASVDASAVPRTRHRPGFKFRGVGNTTYCCQCCCALRLAVWAQVCAQRVGLNAPSASVMPKYAPESAQCSRPPPATTFGMPHASGRTLGTARRGAPQGAAGRLPKRRRSALRQALCRSMQPRQSTKLAQKSASKRTQSWLKNRRQREPTKYARVYTTPPTRRASGIGTHA